MKIDKAYFYENLKQFTNKYLPIFIDMPINKDFFEFEHGYLFDEIITDMPQVTSVKGEEEIRSLYFHFFEKAELHLKDDSVIILYATEPGFVGQAIKRGNTFKITERYVLNEKNGTTVFIIHRRGYNAQNE